ncbi:DnaB-like helicase C-terminal domain-containing protein [Streptomyces virginiae]|uniref:DnaB-like helicase C-terminal domain-containing protein n=1 Tax=Streptomyces virginiae TaxID=1961 RepID=UPI00371AE2BB
MAVAVKGKRRLAAAADVLGAGGDLPRLSFGLPALDAVVQGIGTSRLTLIAASPGAGGSLLAVAAARQTALAEGRGVLYAASGLSEADGARVVAAHAAVSYHGWRAGTLPGPEAAAARLAEAALRDRNALFIEDGADLDAAVISEVATDWGGAGPLALVVVDRLQHMPDEHPTLSGEALPDAVRSLARLARLAQVPVLAVVDSDDPGLTALLDADVTLALTRMGQASRIDVSERGMGRLASVAVEPDIPQARFLPLPRHIAERLLREDVIPTVMSAPAEPAAEDVPVTSAVAAVPADGDALPATAVVSVPGGAAAGEDIPALPQAPVAGGEEPGPTPSAGTEIPAGAVNDAAPPPGSWPAAVSEAAAASARGLPETAHLPPAGPQRDERKTRSSRPRPTTSKPAELPTRWSRTSQDSPSRARTPRCPTSRGRRSTRSPRSSPSPSADGRPSN